MPESMHAGTALKACPVQLSQGKLQIRAARSGLPGGALLTNGLLRRSAAQVLASAVALAAFGVIGASLGGAGRLKGGLRVIVGGLAAMGITYGFGRLFVVRPSP